MKKRGTKTTATAALLFALGTTSWFLKEVAGAAVHGLSFLEQAARLAQAGRR